jgi:hypothetical protein
MTKKRFIMPTPTVINKYRFSDVISRRYWDKYFFSNMSINPVIAKLGGGAAAGAGAETDIMTDAKSIFEYYNIVGNTNLGPKLGGPLSDGSYSLNLATDATSTHGVEYNTGITPANNFTFLIDTSGNTTPAFFMQGQFQLTTVAGATLLMGFRQIAADGIYTGYTNYAAIGLIAGEFETNTRLSPNAAIATDTTQAGVNATLFQIAVYVDAYGNVTYQINDNPPVVSVAYQFANGITVMPFVQIVQNITTTAAAYCNYLECGFQS